MNYTICQKCKKRNLYEDINCGICSAKLDKKEAFQTVKEKNTNLTPATFGKPRILRGIVMFFIIAFLIYKNCNLKNTNITPTYTTSELMICACLISESFVQEQLISSSSAEFDMCSENCVVNNGNNEFFVRRRVSAVNEFNVRMEKRYRCGLKYIGGEPADKRNWKLIKIEIDE